MSYFDICAASGDRVSDQVASAIRDALAGHLPDSLTVELPCHSPRTERWFDTLISSRRDDRGHIAGATVTLSLTRAQTRVLLPDRAGRPAGRPGTRGSRSWTRTGNRSRPGPGQDVPNG